MALIECKECKNQVSTKADKCPSCGAKVPKKVSVIHVIGIIVFGLIFIAFVSKNNDETATASASAPTAVAETALDVTAPVLAQEYDQNEARADAIYKNKLLHVSGTVTGITKDFANSTVVTLRGVNEFAGVHAEMEKSEEQKAINLQKGQKIKVQCRGKGEVVSIPVLDDCTIL